jgi:hypothetical protein
MSKWNISLMPHGDDWRNARKMFRQQFHTGIAGKYQPRESVAAHTLLRRLLADPANFLQTVHR